MIQANELVGRTVGEYQIERLLGQSHLGVAYRAHHLVQGHKATVTMFSLPADMLPHEYEQLRVRFARDGEALVQLNHPHILPIYAYGVQQGFIYFVTAFVKEASLAQFLKQNTRFTPQQVLPILKQLTEGLEYAHSQGLVHGMLSLSNVMVSNDLAVHIAGFGLRTILDIRGSTPDASLVNQASHERSTFLLSNAEYIAPERLLGQAIDARADVYALGVILYVLLSGIQPFQGAQPLDVALQRLQQPAPALHSVCPEVPEAFDLIIGRALERDPAKRLQHAGEMMGLFERVLKSQDAARGIGRDLSGQLAQDSQATLPPTINWFDEQVMPDGFWQPAERLTNASLSEGAQASPVHVSPNSASGSDPFAWWATISTGRARTSPTPGTFPWSTPVRAAPKARPRPDQQGRRRLISIIAIGTAAAGVTIASVSFTRFLQSIHQPSPQIASGSPNGNAGSPGSSVPTSPSSTGTIQGTTGAGGTAISKTGTPQPTATKGGARGTPTAQPTVKPTATQSIPTPTAPPAHTGTVIGATSMATNSSKTFTNPADGKSSLLIHLANGSFVACERACTHEGVLVNYDSGSQTIVCPAHNAVFNPVSGFAHVSGPGGGALPTVSIRVNADGTITTG